MTYREQGQPYPEGCTSGPARVPRMRIRRFAMPTDGFLPVLAIALLVLAALLRAAPVQAQDNTTAIPGWTTESPSSTAPTRRVNSPWPHT